MFDSEAVLELIDLSKDTEPAMLDQIIQNFSAAGPQLISEIKMAYEENNLEAVERAAHKLKGSAGMLGLLNLAQKANEIMTSARCHEDTKPQETLSELKSVLQSSLIQLIDFVEQNKN